MKLTAIIFIVWVAQAQGQSSSSTESSSTVTSATSSTGSTVTVSTVTESTSTGSTGSTITGATSAQSTSTGTLSSTSSGATLTSSTGPTVSAATGSTSTESTGSTRTGATSAPSTSTVTMASTSSGATEASSTGSTVSAATGSTSTGNIGSTSTGVTSDQSTSTGTIASTISGATGASATVSVVSTTTSGIAGSTISTSTGSVVDTTSGGTGSTNTGAVATTSAGVAGSTSTGEAGGSSTETPSAVMSTPSGSGSAGITTSNTAEITTPTVGGTTTVGGGTIAPGLTTIPSSNITQTVPDAETTTEVPIQSTTPGSMATATLIVTPNTSENVTVGNTVPVTPIQIPTIRPIPDCTPIEAPARLRINGARPCLVKKFNDQSIQIKSPNFPQDYPNSVECKARTSSAGPRYLEITPKLVAVHKSDRLIIKGPFGYKKRIRSEDVNKPITLPSAYSKIEFKSNDRKTMKGFRVNVRSRTNSCQRICSLQAGASGYLNNGPYGANSFCEWWLEAPTGCFVRMRFEEFDVGPASSGGTWSCEGDYVGVDRDGDPTYGRPRSRTFCGSDIPRGVRSKDNKINVLFNGRDGGYNGFKIKYTVVC